MLSKGIFFLTMQQLRINVSWLIILTYSGRRQRTSRSNDSRIIFLSLPLINSNINIGTTYRLPSLRHSIALIFIVVRIVTMNGAFDRRFRRSPEISKRKIPPISARSLQFPLLSGGHDFFGAVIDQIKNRVTLFLYVQHQSVARIHIDARVQTHTETIRLILSRYRKIR